MDANPKSRKAILLVSLLFLLGIALGAVGGEVLTDHWRETRQRNAGPRGGRDPVRALAMYTRDLNLNQDQQKQIQAILEDVRNQYAEIQKNVRPEYDRVRQQGRERVRQVLTPEQRPKFEDLLRRMDQERKEREEKGRGR